MRPALTIAILCATACAAHPGARWEFQPHGDGVRFIDDSGRVRSWRRGVANDVVDEFYFYDSRGLPAWRVSRQRVDPGSASVCARGNGLENNGCVELSSQPLPPVTIERVDRYTFDDRGRPITRERWIDETPSERLPYAPPSTSWEPPRGPRRADGGPERVRWRWNGDEPAVVHVSPPAGASGDPATLTITLLREARHMNRVAHPPLDPLGMTHAGGD